MRETLQQPVPEQRSPTVESRVALHRHPLHPVAVVYPIACLTLLLPADVLHLWSGRMFWAEAAWWLNVVGLVAGLMAAGLGIADMFLIRVARRHVSAWSHFIAGVMLLALAAAGVWLRWPDPAAAGWWALAHSAPTAAMVLVVGWLGGTLSFGHGIGVYGHRERDEDDASDRALDE
ncbi:DUF2231 domain-containing protein [Luteimonas composti]|uniref:DUF2231 domain-containing protein n=1 Tax=Luteimonas composti TaxID=398257 RepID=A0ABT6MPY5_9GAMM|nr:DUF2231 domain-containing protein [Luteimonas composti]MDH7452691.1 DUF2231 domain-containing protein [Luteimonas composti]